MPGVPATSRNPSTPGRSRPRCANSCRAYNLACAPRASATAVQRSMTKKPLILIVEDDPSSLMLATAALEADGFDVAGSESAELAREAISRRKPALILMDIGLPGMGARRSQPALQPCGARGQPGAQQLHGAVRSGGPGSVRASTPGCPSPSPDRHGPTPECVEGRAV